MKFQKNSLTVDPGWNTGLAYWHNLLFPLTNKISLPKRVLTLEEKLDILSDKFRGYCNVNRPTFMYIEGVSFYENSIVSLTAAKRGDLFNLSILIGRYIEIVSSFGAKSKIVLPKEWKGQISKEGITRRIKRVNNILYKDHVADAVGIGFSMQGVL